MQVQRRPLAATIQQMGSGRCSRMAKMIGDVENAVAEPAPPLGADKSSLATGSATLSLAAGSASGGIRLCTGVNMGYRLIGPPLGKGTFGTPYHAVWNNGVSDAGGQRVVVKRTPLARPSRAS